MRLLQIILCVLALTGPLAGCLSYSSHEEGYSRPYGSYDEGYYGPYYGHPRYYDNRNDQS